MNRVISTLNMVVVKVRVHIAGLVTSPEPASRRGRRETRLVDG